VFEEVTKREGGRRAARKSAYLFGSTTFQVALLAALVFVSNKIRAQIAEGPVVDVKFVKGAIPPPPPPPPPAPPKRKSPKPPSDVPKPKAPPPAAMIQPRDIQEEIKLPDKDTPPEPEYDEGDGDGAEGGVIGGVVGGGYEEAPQYASVGWRPPVEKERGCVSRGVRLPKELQGFASLVTAKFGIKPNGQPYAFALLTPLDAAVKPRFEQAIWAAVYQCEWVPGVDARGRPVSIWVTLPIRFTAG
jgi:protein TonB